MRYQGVDAYATLEDYVQNTPKREIQRVYKELVSQGRKDPSMTSAAEDLRDTWKRLFNEDLFSKRQQQEVEDIPTRQETLKKVSKAIEMQMVLRIFLVMILAFLGAGAFFWYDGKVTPISKITAPIVNPVLDDMERIVATAIAPEPCEPSAKVVAKITCSDRTGCQFPGTSELTPGGLIQVEGYEILRKNWETKGIDQTVQALADKMSPLYFDSKVYYDYKEAYAVTVKAAFEDPEKRPCIWIPDSTNWERNVQTALIAGILGVTQAPQPTQPDPTEPPIPTATATPYSKEAMQIPGDFLKVDEPTLVPLATYTPEPHPTQVAVLIINSPFTKAVEQLQVMCTNKFGDSRTKALVCTAIAAKMVQGGKVTAETQSDINGMNICATNLGERNWRKITDGSDELWNHGNSFLTFGKPGELVLFSTDNQTCAITNNSAEYFNDQQWLTRPDDPNPDAAGFGSPFGTGFISTQKTGAANVHVGKVYIWPIKQR